MYAIIHHNPDSFEFLPSIAVQRCFGKYFWYVSWFTFSLEIGPDETEDNEE